jgi:hypothetical protein
MAENAFVPVEESAAAEVSPHPGRPAVTFMGNTYDLASLGALASGVLLLFMCMTCNQGFLCLPFVPIVAGIIGLLSARQAVNEERTKLWSWLGIGMGGAVLVLIGVAVLLYLAVVAVAVVSSGELG